MSVLMAALLTTATVQPPLLSSQPLPFCSILSERVTPVIMTEAADNDAIARIFPALRDYHTDYKDLNVGRASLDVYRLKRISAQLQSDQATLRVALNDAGGTAADAADRELLAQMRVATTSIFAEQQGVQRALKAFIDDEAAAADATNGRVTMAGQMAENSLAGIRDARLHIQDVGSHLAMIAAGAMSVGVLNDVAYAQPMVANGQHILSAESYLHNLVSLAIERCYSRRQSTPPTPHP